MKSYKRGEFVQFKELYLLVICGPKLIIGHETQSKIIKCNCNKRDFRLKKR